jgi:hypothetical protein
MNVAEFKAGYKAFQEHEPRDAMYRIASFLTNHFWGNAKEMADSLGVLLLTWNQAFYRYGMLDFNALEECIERTQQIIDLFRNRNILSFTSKDDNVINNLYEKFLLALQISDGKLKGRQSPVGTAKALHLLAPAFFPLWDEKIAVAYKCKYNYIPFMGKIKELAELIEPEVDITNSGKTLLKFIDEYNYAKYTKSWI